MKFFEQVKAITSMKMNKKGLGLQDLMTYGLIFVATAIILAIGSQILGQMRATQTTGTAEYNITGYGLSSLGTLGQWMPIIAIVIAAVVIIGVLIYNFRFKQ